jgi:hypothetical protein
MKYKNSLTFFLLFFSAEIYLSQVSNHLPVQLIYFNGTIINQTSVLLQWGTATETNNFGYNVERSVNKTNWEVLGFVQGNGNSFSPKDYSFIDSTITTSGQYHYRLRQFDFDGAENISEIVTLEIIVSVRNDLSPINDFKLFNNYPNPFNPSTTVSFYNPVFQKIEISLYTSQNEYVRTIKNEFFEKGLQKIQVDLSHNASGVYLIFVKLNDKFYAQKINFIK